MKTTAQLQAEVDAKIAAGILPKGAEVATCYAPDHCPHWTHRYAAVDVDVATSRSAEGAEARNP